MLIRATLFTVALVTAPVPHAEAQELPPADSLVQAYVEAIGGHEAHTSPVSIRTVGTVRMAAMGLSGDFELLQYAPDRMLLRVSVGGIGQIQSGFDGDVAWSIDPLAGPRILEGAELEASRERADLLAGVRDSSLVPTRETMGLTEYDGDACWRVRLEWASGRESFDCYSTETGLLIASEDQQVSQMGEIQITTTFDDYQEFDGGMYLPTRMVQQGMGQVQEMIVEAVEVNTLAPEALDPPSSIRTLMNR